MALRRLADVQPASFAFTPANEAWCKGEIAKYPKGREASAVIALLWRAQAQNDYWLPKPAIEKVGEMLAMPYIRVLEIATFYSMFNLEPVGKHFIQLCGTTPCMLRGSNDIRAVLERRVGEQRKVTGDGNFAWAEVECLGACCNAPMVQVNDDFYEDLTPENFGKLLDDLAAGRPVKKGSQAKRISSEPMPGPVTTLVEGALYDGSRVGAWKKRFEQVAAPAEATPAAAPVVQPPVAAPVASPASPAAADAAAQAAEEADMAAKIAALPKDATPEAKANAVGAKPAGLAAARDGKADDLQRITGIGPVNEKKLNALGMFHFDQVAAWSRAEVRWVGTYLSFPGRIDRENWLAQAATLAKGGTPGPDKTK